MFYFRKRSSALVVTSTWFSDFGGLLNFKERYINRE